MSPGEELYDCATDSRILTCSLTVEMNESACFLFDLIPNTIKDNININKIPLLNGGVLPMNTFIEYRQLAI